MRLFKSNIYIINYRSVTETTEYQCRSDKSCTSFKLIPFANDLNTIISPPTALLSRQSMQSEEESFYVPNQSAAIFTNVSVLTVREFALLKLESKYLSVLA